MPGKPLFISRIFQPPHHQSPWNTAAAFPQRVQARWLLPFIAGKEPGSARGADASSLQLTGLLVEASEGLSSTQYSKGVALLFRSRYGLSTGARQPTLVAWLSWAKAKGRGSAAHPV